MPYSKISGRKNGEKVSLTFCLVIKLQGYLLVLPSWTEWLVVSLLSCLYLSGRFSFEVATPESTFYMYAETEKEKDDWIGAIGRYV